MIKFSACIVNNKGKQELRNNFKSGGTRDLQAKRAKKIF